MQMGVSREIRKQKWQPNVTILEFDSPSIYAAPTATGTWMGDKDTTPSWPSRDSQTRQRRRERTRSQHTSCSVTNRSPELWEHWGESNLPGQGNIPEHFKGDDIWTGPCRMLYFSRLLKGGRAFHRREWKKPWTCPRMGISSIQFSCSVMSKSLQPHGL